MEFAWWEQVRSVEVVEACKRHPAFRPTMTWSLLRSFTPHISWLADNSSSPHSPILTRILRQGTACHTPAGRHAPYRLGFVPIRTLVSFQALLPEILLSRVDVGIGCPIPTVVQEISLAPYVAMLVFVQVPLHHVPVSVYTNHITHPVPFHVSFSLVISFSLHAYVA